MVRASGNEANALNRIVDSVFPRFITDFLNKVIVNTSWVWINYWSFVHFGFGMLFYFILRGNFLGWIAISVVFEIVEYLLAFWEHPLFVEEFVDIGWDLIFNIGGFFLAKLIWERLAKKSFK